MQEGGGGGGGGHYTLDMLNLLKRWASKTVLSVILFSSPCKQSPGGGIRNRYCINCRTYGRDRSLAVEDKPCTRSDFQVIEGALYLL